MTTLTRDEITNGFIAEMARFEEQVGSIPDEEWTTPTCCEGWTVADVAAHVSGTLADIAAGRFEGLGSPEVTDREVAERRGSTQKELADEIHEGTAALVTLAPGFDDAAWNGPAPAGTGTLGEGVEALWYDAFVHGNDIRSASGQPPALGDGVRAALSHSTRILGEQGWGPATIDAGSAGRYPVGDGSGRTVTVDALGFILASTGRLDPAEVGLDEAANIYR